MSSKPSLFLISGLGADSRAFDRLDLDGYEVTHLNWLIPERGETMNRYAQRLSEPVRQAEHPVVIGVSLGGMLASEMTTFLPDIRAILISSIKSPEERSLILKAGRVFPIQGLMPISVMKRMSFLWTYAKRKYPPEDVKHMIDMFHSIDNRFLRWGMMNAPRWKGRGDSSRIAHIHGDRDLMFPIGRIRGCDVVEGGTHLMVYQRGEEVTRLIRSRLEQWYPNSL